MTQVHVVRSGDTLSSIAAEHGFADFRTVFDHPDNAALKELRPNPHVLFPGDRVVIPDREDKAEAAPTGARTTLVVQIQPLHLRVRIRDLDNVALKPTAEVLLATGGADDEVPLNPDGDGLVERPIGRRLKRAEIRVVDQHIKMDLVVGGLDPVQTLSGQRARLNNLGYFAGFASEDKEQFRWAAEEFKKDRKVAPLAVAEDDIDPEAGLPAGPFTAKLEQEHGS